MSDRTATHSSLSDLPETTSAVNTVESCQLDTDMLDLEDDGFDLDAETFDRIMTEVDQARVRPR